MTKARTLADFISDGSPLADGTISVSEVSGAAPLASPTFTGTATVSGNLSVDGGTTNLDVVDIDGAVNFAADVTFADGADIITATAGTSNFRAGANAGNSIVSGGNYNTVVGDNAGTAITTGDSNVALGTEALYNNTAGGNNIASGLQALYSNTTGGGNVASGTAALRFNTTGANNVASGFQSLYANTTGSSNVASGREALRFNTTGANNTASGFKSLYANTTASYNVASGHQSLYANTTGASNVASGFQSLYNNTTGSSNVASGYNSLYNNTTGFNNVASGRDALYNNTTGRGNTAINPRNNAGTYLPVFDPTTENNRFCMGSTGVTNAYIQVAWTVVSDKRDKTDISPVPHGLDFVKALKPTAFRYKANRDDVEGHGPLRYGFLAQDVLELEGENPVIVDNETPEKLRITDQSLIAVLVNAIQEQQATITALTARITALEGA